MAVRIRPAVAAERPALEALQLRASMHSGTYADALRAEPEVIAIPSEQLADGLVRVAERDGAPAGFAVLLAPREGACELDGLFVEPAHMGTGVGRRLVEDAVARARAWGAEAIDVVANPDALGFYERLGFRGEAELPTRFGPAVRMRLAIG